MNAGFEYREQVGSEAAGRTVLAHLVERYRHSSFPVWSERIAEGQVLIEGTRAEASSFFQRF